MYLLLLFEKYSRIFYDGYMDECAILTENLTKKFNPSANSGLTAVDNVNLKIKQGEIYSLMGENGAGKTTLIKILTGLMLPTSGRAYIFNHNIVKSPLSAKKMFGYVSDNPTVYDYLTGKEFLYLTGSLREIPEKELKEKIESLSGLFPIKDVLNQKMGSYSRGNRQKVAFLASMLDNPKLLLIDEPVAGLDPGSIEIFGQSLREFKNKGGTVFFVTHILSFAQAYATSFGFMKNGRILEEGVIDQGVDLKSKYDQLTKY